jgi:putative transposase
MQAVTEAVPRLGVAVACNVIGLPRASFYRGRRPAVGRRPRRSPPRALSQPEQEEVMSVLHEARFADWAPAQVYAQLLDEGHYLCSVRTMQRLLASRGEAQERRDQRIHPAYARPELLATKPNELWSWDITKLLGPRKWTYYYLYVILDVFSRFVVGWMVALRESAMLAQHLIAETCRREAIAPGQLTLHADRGSSMTSKPVALLLSDLGVTKTHSRPHVSNDNPFSESQFKTLKYRPAFPDRFGSPEHARGLSRDLLHWYNHEHHHSGLGFLTPADVHHGRAPERIAARGRVLEAAYARHPERFVGGLPQSGPVPTAVWINKPAQPEKELCMPAVAH